MQLVIYNVVDVINTITFQVQATQAVSPMLCPMKPCQPTLLIRLLSMLPQKIFKNHKIFEKKSQDLDSKSQVYKIKFLMTFYAKLKSVITSESAVMTFELHRLS